KTSAHGSTAWLSSTVDDERQRGSRRSPTRAALFVIRLFCLLPFYFCLYSVAFRLLSKPLADLFLRRLASKLRAQTHALVLALVARSVFERVVCAITSDALPRRLACARRLVRVRHPSALLAI